jgi:hypothetical protein
MLKKSHFLGISIQGLLPLKSSLSDASNVKKELMKCSPIENLRNYKVVGIASPGVLVVVNIAEKRGPKCYAIKVRIACLRYTRILWVISFFVK